MVYDADAHGNRVPDFSTCGYAGGDRPIPDAPVRVVVSPVTGDETARIQKAIDYVAGLPADTNGLRGAVLLLKGGTKFPGGCRSPIPAWCCAGRAWMRTERFWSPPERIAARSFASPVKMIFRAAQMPTGKSPTITFRSARPVFISKTPAALKPATRFDIIRPSTKEWIDALGMTEFGGGVGDWRLVWHPGSHDLAWDRVIQKIDGNLVTVDAPITTAMEKDFGGGRVETYSWPGRIATCRRGKSPARIRFRSAKSQGRKPFLVGRHDGKRRRRLGATGDFEHFAGSAVAIYESCKWVTVEDCLSLAPVSEKAGWRRNTFFTMGQQTLFLRCWAEHGRHDFSVGHCAAGPNAFVQCEATLPVADSGAIESWASGTLFDNVRIDGSGLSLVNRGAHGEGAGWSAANSVLWQCSASKISCENPPGAQNWAFGCWGEFAGNGIWRSSNASVKPVSLFVAQVADRLGSGGCGTN